MRRAILFDTGGKVALREDRHSGLNSPLGRIALAAKLLPSDLAWRRFLTDCQRGRNVRRATAGFALAQCRVDAAQARQAKETSR